MNNNPKPPSCDGKTKDLPQMHNNDGIYNPRTAPKSNATTDSASSSAADGVNNSGKRKRGAAFYIAIVIAVLAIIVACVFTYLWWQDQQVGSRDSNALIGQLEGKSQEEIQAELDRKVEEGMFNISIASRVEFESGTSKGPLRIENVPGNRYLMQVEILRDDTGEVIYKSGVIDPNYHIQEAELDVALPAGTYECTALFYALDPETEDQIGKVAAKMVITVLN
ncbi:hypothetical protein [Adlercreutzia sp. ZJ154]|uniref:hypothetical protein n=1 Tax=Adlercreutzia sp. ZJ154 TaxID=2709790 RepID=UPI0013EA85CB|nr:hypothetical protein [Adlercreutzia sp. ZJ154]